MVYNLKESLKQQIKEIMAETNQEMNVDESMVHTLVKTASTSSSKELKTSGKFPDAQASQSNEDGLDPPTRTNQDQDERYETKNKPLRGDFGAVTDCHPMKQNKGESASKSAKKSKTKGNHSTSSRSLSWRTSSLLIFQVNEPRLPKEPASHKSLSNQTKSIILSGVDMSTWIDHQDKTLYEQKRSTSEMRTEMERKQVLEQIERKQQLSEKLFQKETIELIKEKRRKEEIRRKEKHEHEMEEFEHAKGRRMKEFKWRIMQGIKRSEEKRKKEEMKREERRKQKDECKRQQFQCHVAELKQKWKLESQAIGKQLERLSMEKEKRRNLQEIQDSKDEESEWNADVGEIVIIKDKNPSEIESGQKISETVQTKSNETTNSVPVLPVEQPASSIEITMSYKEMGINENGKATSSSLENENCNPAVNCNRLKVNVCMSNAMGVEGQSTRGSLPVDINNSEDIVGDLHGGTVYACGPTVGVIEVNQSNTEGGLLNSNRPHTGNCSVNGQGVQLVTNGNKVVSKLSRCQNPSVSLVTMQGALLSCEPPVFTGDLRKYQTFLGVFDTAICSKVYDTRQRLVNMLQYMKRTCHEMVKRWRIGKTNDCYQEAIDLLTEHYVHTLHVGEAWLVSVVNEPQVKQNGMQGLTKFPTELMVCTDILSSINTSTVSTYELDRIDSWTPSGWLSRMDDVLHNDKMDVMVDYQNNCVRKSLREVINVPSPESSSVKKYDELGKSEFASTIVNKSDVSIKNQNHCCSMCRGVQVLNQCTEFRCMSYNDRCDLVIKCELCRCCLKPGHRTESCQRENPCEHYGGNGRQTTLLHPPMNANVFRNDVPVDMETQNDKPAVAACGLNAVKTKHGVFANASANVTILLHVAPVQVRLAGSTYYVVINALCDRATNSIEQGNFGYHLCRSKAQIKWNPCLGKCSKMKCIHKQVCHISYHKVYPPVRYKIEAPRCPWIFNGLSVCGLSQGPDLLNEFKGRMNEFCDCEEALQGPGCVNTRNMCVKAIT